MLKKISDKTDEDIERMAKEKQYDKCKMKMCEICLDFYECIFEVDE